MSTQRDGKALSPILVLGLDGACFEILEPLFAAGRLPNLAAWRAKGVSAPLRSTVPPMSFPAWSTFLTGLAPGRHGLFDFTQKAQNAYRLAFANASDRRGAAFYSRVTQAGGRCLVLGVPGTFPPEPVDGLLVAGFDAPVSIGTNPRSASDPDVYRRIAERVGPWMTADLDERASATDWHERAIAHLHRRIDRKCDFALEALRQLRAVRAGVRPELMLVVFSESDTVAHHYWRDHDPDSPRHDATTSAARRDAIAAVYEHLDQVCGQLRRAYGEDALCIVVSDHGGGGAADRVVHLNAKLLEAGLYARTAKGGAALDTAARRARDFALRWLPARVSERIFRRARTAAARIESAARFGGIDWSRTSAFSEEANTQPGVWINLKGRESAGCVDPADYERVRDRVIATLTDWTLPDGQPVVARARRREAVYSGPCCDRAPDVVVELALDRGYGLSLVQTPWSSRHPAPVRTLDRDEYAGGRGRGMNGTHRPEGIWIASGHGAGALDLGVTPALEDVAPTLMRAMGVAWEGDLDGTAHFAKRIPYSAAEEAIVAERLRKLGYLE
jgi:predicted AlkP superfamily phosphohydrolase/phosphomutase